MGVSCSLVRSSTPLTPSWANSTSKAALVGANTVKRPGPLRASTSSALVTAATRVLQLGLPAATSTMVLLDWARPPVIAADERNSRSNSLHRPAPAGVSVFFMAIGLVWWYNQLEKV